MTNIEKIQSMNVTELSSWLYQARICPYITHCSEGDCKKCIERWLEEECGDEDY